ncbi:hypothetical protein CRG98_015533 [Punica granatum]|uniref:Uncharacterized protein n=1 Tax=Punica granatum TaxID=22663 RepID=A0A2I0K6B1_PUNGR|nr:hypothetical protein CRG98_015533 [Punica granatum]
MGNNRRTIGLDRIGSERPPEGETARKRSWAGLESVGPEWAEPAKKGEWAAADGLGWLGWTCDGNAMGRSPLMADLSDGNAGGAERLRAVVPAVGRRNDGAKGSG